MIAALDPKTGYVLDVIVSLYSDRITLRYAAKAHISKASSEDYINNWVYLSDTNKYFIADNVPEQEIDLNFKNYINLTFSNSLINAITVAGENIAYNANILYNSKNTEVLMIMGNDDPFIDMKEVNLDALIYLTEHLKSGFSSPIPTVVLEFICDSIEHTLIKQNKYCNRRY